MGSISTFIKKNKYTVPPLFLYSIISSLNLISSNSAICTNLRLWYSDILFHFSQQIFDSVLKSTSLDNFLLHFSLQILRKKA